MLADCRSVESADIIKTPKTAFSSSRNCCEEVSAGTCWGVWVKYLLRREQVQDRIGRIHFDRRKGAIAGSSTGGASPASDTRSRLRGRAGP